MPGLNCTMTSLRAASDRRGHDLVLRTGARARLAEWNGYHKIDRDMLDGVSFSLSVEFEDGRVINASGSNCFPRAYSEKVSAIKDFFEKLMEEYGFDPNDLWL